MYVVVTAGGKQIKVAQGDLVRVEKMEGPVGDTVELKGVNLVAKDDGVVVDANALENAKVVCEIVRQGRGKKVRVYKKKRKKNYQRTHGHRQAYTQLKVRSIEA
jgi:large subunit ribosomal protein L21